MYHPHDDLCKGVWGYGVYQVCVRIDCGGLRCGLGLFLHRPGYFNVMCDGRVLCVPAPSCARNRSSPALALIFNFSAFWSRYRRYL